jgi:hypothetical protein
MNLSRNALRIESHTTLENTKIVTNPRAGELNKLYPDSLAAKKEAARTAKGGLGYEGIKVGPPLEMPQEYIDQMHNKIQTILTVFTKLSDVYNSKSEAGSNTSKYPLLVKILQGQFEDSEIQKMMTDLKDCQTTIGARFGADVIGDKILEINMSCPGGVLGMPTIIASANGEELVESNNQNEEYAKTIDEYYKKATGEASRDRSIAVLYHDASTTVATQSVIDFENLGYTNVNTLPAEAILYNGQKAYFVDAESGEEVYLDQVILSYHYQALPGDPISQAIMDGNLVAEASNFSKIVLAGKSTMAVMTMLLENKILAKSLGVTTDELETIDNSLPKTYQSSSKYFRKNGITALNFEEKLEKMGRNGAANGLDTWFKLSSGVRYGSRGVFKAYPDKKTNRKLIQEYKKEVRAKANESGLAVFNQVDLLSQLVAYLKANNMPLGITNDELVAQLKTVSQNQEYAGEKIFEGLTIVIKSNLKTNIGDVLTSNLTNFLYYYAITKTVLPVIIQEGIAVDKENNFEIRMAGSISNDNGENGVETTTIRNYGNSWIPDKSGKVFNGIVGTE